MLFQNPTSCIVLWLAALTQGTPLEENAACLQTCSCGETSILVCYGGSSGGTSQNLDIADIEYTGTYIRHLADTADDLLWTTPYETDFCEWSLPIYDAYTVLALVKYISPRSNSSITYDDIARTIHGQERDGSTKSRGTSLLDACSTGGRRLGVVLDTTNEAFSLDSYVASKATPSGLIVKFVRDPNRSWSSGYSIGELCSALPP